MRDSRCVNFSQSLTRCNSLARLASTRARLVGTRAVQEQGEPPCKMQPACNHQRRSSSLVEGEEVGFLFRQCRLDTFDVRVGDALDVLLRAMSLVFGGFFLPH